MFGALAKNMSKGSEQDNLGDMVDKYQASDG